MLQSIEYFAMWKTKKGKYTRKYGALSGGFVFQGCVCLLQCIAACCGVLQCVAVCCSVLQCIAVCCSASCVAVYNEKSKDKKIQEMWRPA